ncbi:ribosome biogenesis GTP-binding protein YihA/YsxC [Ruminococcus sp.]|uniref:ribosome biogenesis GTP-binding protein YihA/YsxC n=1 Tax=Ruminococcus sp. TaxID=41978 RepID=UPI0025DF4918|nr:ribosome biogenesis GTP-binding protein YihA/YsxC [Ruminococcus sp.]MBQ9542415.1 YihA family ribosome biogenesis GTP-binding protein [Ruminococcus sp.]
MKPLNFNKAEFVTSYGKFSQIPKSDRPEFAFSGRSNVGKSSLINKIFNRKNMARVSSVPGKTVTINFFSVEDVYFVDLPGYGYANVSKAEKGKWGELIGGYLGDFERYVEIVFQLIDMRHAPSKDDIQMINYLIDNEMPFVIVLTKADKLKPTARKARMAAFADEIPCFEDIHCIPFSAVTGEGVDELKAVIEEVRQDWFDTYGEETRAETSAEEAAEIDSAPDEDDDDSDFTGFLTPNRKK